MHRRGAPLLQLWVLADDLPREKQALLVHGEVIAVKQADPHHLDLLESRVFGLKLHDPSHEVAQSVITRSVDQLHTFKVRYTLVVQIAVSPIHKFVQESFELLVLVVDGCIPQP